MAEYGVGAISVLTPHHRLRPRAADLPRPWNTTQPSQISATHIGKRLAGKLHEPFERAGGGMAISPTSPDSTPRQSSNNAGRSAAESMEGRRLVKGSPLGNARSGRRTGPAWPLRRRGPVAQ